MHQILRLIIRNFTATIDKSFLVWQIFFPMIYIFIAGYAYSSIIDSVDLGKISISYPAFIASGMIGFNVMNSSTVAGTIVWNDKRNGMFEQILTGPFTRAQYIAANIITIIIMGLISGGIIIAASIITVFSDVSISILTSSYVILAIILGSIFFGSLAIITSIKLRTSEGFQVILNTIFLFFAFVSTVFYPSESTLPLSGAFYFNPLTHVVDMIRFGLFGDGNLNMLAIETISLIAASTTLFITSAYMLKNLNV